MHWGVLAIFFPNSMDVKGCSPLCFEHFEKNTRHVRRLVLQPPRLFPLFFAWP